jgi:hypothetical protein
MSARADLAQRLALDPTAPTKTFVLEVHTDDPENYLNGLFGENAVTGTTDAFLYHASLDGGEMWVDQLDHASGRSIRTCRYSQLGASCTSGSSAAETQCRLAKVDQAAGRSVR